MRRSSPAGIHQLPRPTTSMNEVIESVDDAFAFLRGGIATLRRRHTRA